MEKDNINKTKYDSKSMSAKKTGKKTEDTLRTETVKLDTKGVSKAYDDISKAFLSSTEKMESMSKKSLRRISSDTLSSYNDMYDKIANIHEEFIQFSIKSESKAVLDTTVNIVNTYAKMYSTLESMHNKYLDAYIHNEKIAATKVANAWNNTNATSSSKRKSKKSGERQATSSKSIADEASTFSKTITSTTSALETLVDTHESKLKSIGSNTGETLASFGKNALKIISNIGSSIINIISGDLKAGYNNYIDAYNSEYGNTATKTGLGSDTSDFFSSAIDAIKDAGMNGIVNYTSDLIPEIRAVSNQGFIGNKAQSKAVADSISKVLEPWLDTNSSWYTTMYMFMDKASTDMIKSQMLILKQSEEGNSLLQSGVIDNLLNDIYPALSNIDWNTMDKSDISGDMMSLVEMFKATGLTDQEAYQQATKYYDVYKNPYAALTSGDVSKVMLSQNIDKYGLVEGSRQFGNDIATKKSYTSNNMQGVWGTIGDLFGAVGGVERDENYDRGLLSSGNLSDEQYQTILNKYSNMTGAEIENYYKSSSDYVSNDTEITNKLQNATAQVGDTVKDIAKATDLTNVLLTSINALLTTIISSKVFQNLTGKSFDSLIKSASTKTGVKTGAEIANKIGTTTSSTATAATTAGIAGGTAAIIGGGFAVGDTIYRKSQKDTSVVSSDEKVANAIATTTGIGAVASGGAVLTATLAGTGVGIPLAAVTGSLTAVAVGADIVARQLDETSAITKDINATYKERIKTAGDTLDEMSTIEEKRNFIVENTSLTYEELMGKNSRELEKLYKAELKSQSKAEQQEAQFDTELNAKNLGTRLDELTKASQESGESYSQEVYDILADMGASNKALKKYTEGKWDASGILNGEGGGIGKLNTQKDLAKELTAEQWGTYANKYNFTDALTVADNYKYYSIATGTGNYGLSDTSDSIANTEAIEKAKQYNDSLCISTEVNGSHANGLDSVPYNGYIAELHKGEGILTASENKAYKSSMKNAFNTMTKLASSTNNININSSNNDAIVSALYEISNEIIKAIKEVNISGNSISSMIKPTNNYNQSLVNLMSTV